ncbi:hypothetical protein K469DRAFT_689775 [Zopfia rhizophila CBS 207.26]|uniref:Uncharacterized protein n=1 Tax=Zopfia rhizophila CBS 207.26 TaxID=1314779 RepID=A0A6A6E146_9PEZI|nr:hypothetical protein K469DRAFT_689775 [Zopfia rhizophila CBS 207.26]
MSLIGYAFRVRRAVKVFLARCPSFYAYDDKQTALARRQLMRIQENVLKDTPIHWPQVGEMDETMAMDLLEKSLIDQALLAKNGAIADLLQKLTYLPFAIVQAAAYINENEITLAEYAALLDDTE